MSVSRSERGLVAVGRGYSDLPIAAGKIDLLNRLAPYSRSSKSSI